MGSAVDVRYDKIILFRTINWITVEPGVSKLIDSKQPGISKHFMFPKISFSA